MNCKHENVVILAEAEIPAERTPAGIVPSETAGTLKVSWIKCEDCGTLSEPSELDMERILKALSFADNGYVI